MKQFPLIVVERACMTTCLVLALAGCMSVEYGVIPRVDRLAQLDPGRSTRADVLQTLGEPRGKGAARMSPDLLSREIWLYEHSQSDGKAVDLKLLLVFFHQEQYDGHLWFGSGMDFGGTSISGAVK